MPTTQPLFKMPSTLPREPTAPPSHQSSAAPMVQHAHHTHAPSRTRGSKITQNGSRAIGSRGGEDGGAKEWKGSGGPTEGQGEEGTVFALVGGAGIRPQLESHGERLGPRPDRPDLTGRGLLPLGAWPPWPPRPRSPSGLPPG